ncbi:MAG: nucleotidyltransferase family protein [Candidatus Sulfotelmatobacter sp.]
MSHISGRISETTSVNLASATSVERPAPISSGALEWDVLLAAGCVEARASDLGRIRGLLENAMEWEAVLRLAQDHGTSSLLYRNLSGLNGVIPSPVMASLRQRYEKNVHKSLFLARELMRILECLDGLGMEVIPYKGIVLSEAYYGDIALRQAGDMDLLVRKRDVVRIKSALRDLGYTTRLVIPEDAVEDYIASGYEWTFDSAAGPNLLELQWALQPRFYAVDFDMDALFERSVNVTLAGRRVKTPSPEDLLLVLSVHAAKHVWGRLIWLCDIAQILKLENLNWDWVQSRTRELGIERILRVSLLLAKHLLGMPIPSAMEKAVLADRAAGALADEIGGNLARGIPADVEQLSYFRLMMRLRERRADRVRFVTRLTFTPGPGEWEAVRLPKTFFPLYRLVRLARLASRFAQG